MLLTLCSRRQCPHTCPPPTPFVSVQNKGAEPLFTSLLTQRFESARSVAEPILTPKEREILKRGWGDWTTFMLSYGLKPFDLDDAEEGKAVLSAMAANDD